MVDLEKGLHQVKSFIGWIYLVATKTQFLWSRDHWVNVHSLTRFRDRMMVCKIKIILQI